MQKSCWACWTINQISNEKYGPPVNHGMCQLVRVASCWYISAKNKDVIEQRTCHLHRRHFYFFTMRDHKKHICKWTILPHKEKNPISKQLKCNSTSGCLFFSQFNLAKCVNLVEIYQTVTFQTSQTYQVHFLLLPVGLGASAFKQIFPLHLK